MKSEIYDLPDCGRYVGQAGTAGNAEEADNGMIKGQDKKEEIEENGIRRDSPLTGQGGDRAESAVSPATLADDRRNEAAAISKNGWTRNLSEIEGVRSRTAFPAIGTHGFRDGKAASASAIRAPGKCGEDAGFTALSIPLFWSFPAGRGVRQPWRSRLWEHRRNQL